MSRTLRFPALLLLILSILHFSAASHVHRALKHRHRHRQDASITATTSTTSEPESAEIAVNQDISNIENGLTALPNDILVFMEAVQSQLQKAEDLLSSLINHATPAQVSSTALSTSSASNVATQSQTVMSTFMTVVLSTTPTPTSTSVTLPLSQTPTSTSRTRVTHTIERTSTIYQTITVPGSQPSSLPLPPNATFPNSTQITTSTAYTTVLGANPQATSLNNMTMTSGGAAPTATYTFDPSSESNVAVCFGQSPDIQAGDLTMLCLDSNVDIVILAFVTSFFTPTGMPSVDFGATCNSSTQAQQLHAPGLKDCSALGQEITTCQKLGKKVLVSLGGYTGTTTIPTADSANQLADNLWDLFGAGNGSDTTLRPFGTDVIIDGFDIDNETRDPNNYDVLAARLRSNFDADSSKTYYLSAAPQCPRPDASIPLSAMAYADFVWVQFYNNPSCDLSGTGFQSSFAEWSADLAAVSNRPKLYVGAPAFAGAGSGYVSGNDFSRRIDLAKELGVDNFGGVMLWDGVRAMSNVDQDGKNYLDYAKASLTT